jgi:hypothetical protein
VQLIGIDQRAIEIEDHRFETREDIFHIV